MILAIAMMTVIALRFRMILDLWQTSTTKVRSDHSRAIVEQMRVFCFQIVLLFLYTLLSILVNVRLYFLFHQHLPLPSPWPTPEKPLQGVYMYNDLRLRKNNPRQVLQGLLIRLLTTRQDRQ